MDGKKAWELAFVLSEYFAVRNSLDDDLDSAEFVTGLAGVGVEGGLGQLVGLCVVHRHK